MELLPAGVPLDFEVTYDTGLSFVAMKVLDVTAGYPGTHVATVPMSENFPTTYNATFTGMDAHRYSIQKAVYTDGTYTTYNTNYAAGSETFRCALNSAVASTGGQAIIGHVTDNTAVMGTVPNDIGVIGIVTQNTTPIVGILQEC